MKNIVKSCANKLTKYEIKMNRKVLRVTQKRVRDKQMRIDRNLKVIWSEWFGRRDLNTSFLLE